VSPAPLEIQQGTTFVLLVYNLRDRVDAVVDPTGWTIRAVARRNPHDGAILAAWSSAPTETEGTAAVAAAAPLPGETVTPGEKWIYLYGTPTMSRAWAWSTARLDIHITEPVSPFREAQISADDTRLILRHTTVHS